MVQRHQQQMIVLGALQQARAQQRTARQVEDEGGLLLGMALGGGLGIGSVAQVDVLQRHAHLDRVDDLGGPVLGGDEAGAQGLMAGEDAIQRLLQRGHVQRAAQGHGAGHQIRQVGTRIELGQHP